MSLELILLIFISFLIFVFITFKCINLPFFLPDMLTDNQKMLAASKQIKLLDWPSYMHDISFNRSQCREYWTLCCVILNRIFKKYEDDFITILLGAAANFVSTIIIYFIFSNFFSEKIGLIASLLYLTSFWPYHISLFIGHVILSQMLNLEQARQALSDIIKSDCYINARGPRNLLESSLKLCYLLREING